MASDLDRLLTAAAAADPVDHMPWLAVRDKMLDDGHGFDARVALILVCKYPDHDGPRELFAQECEREGDGERAEFVRAQMAVAELEADVALVSPRHMPAAQRELDAARLRERELYDACDDDGSLIRRWAGPLSEWGQSLSTMGQPIGRAAVWEYGFIDRVECPAADWLRHADDLVWHPSQGRECPTTAQPVRCVRLTTMPDANLTRANSARKWKSPLEWGRDVMDTWRAEWPGVEFQLPSFATAGAV